MKIVIVGHGPSLKGKKQGAKIDGFDVVVRFGDSFFYQTAEDHGRKIDYILTGDQRVADLLIARTRGIPTDPIETWVYGRPGFRNEKFIMERLEGFNPVVCKVTDKWLERFKEMGATGYCTERAPVPHFSQGMAAIIMAADRLKPRIMYLPGFDAVLSGDRHNYVSGTNHDMIILAQHDFAKEKELLREVKAHYGFEVREWI